MFDRDRTLGKLKVVLLSLLLITACTSPATPAPSSGSNAPAAPEASQSGNRTLSVAVRYEPTDLATKISSGFTIAFSKRLFNAALAIYDGNGVPQPYLAEALPQLNSESWRVEPDGRMTTTYRLRPNLTWHDGTPLSAEDFVFAYQVYSTPGLGTFYPAPQDRMEEVSAPDARTLVIRWRGLFPDAGVLHDQDLEPLPRHLLEALFRAGDPDAFLNSPYWTREFVGTGPFRLVRWESGSFLQGDAFEGHALGRPKIDRVFVHFFTDENTALANLLAENVELALDNSLRFEHAQVLRRDWGSSNKGTVLLDPVQPRQTNIQFRPELVNPRGLLDLRVRKAIAHSVDKDLLLLGLLDGEVPPSDQFLPKTVPYFAELDRAIAKYPFDLRRTEQLMGEVGYRKGGDGLFVNAAGERFSFEHWVIAGSQNERQSAIMADGWRRAGFEVKEYAIPAAQSGDGQVRASFPALSSVATGGGESQLNFLTRSQTPTPANRWRGNNRGAWFNEEYERLWDAFQSTLDRAERTRQVIQMMKIATDDVAMLWLFHSPNVTAHLSTLTGPDLGAPETIAGWNIHQWELK
jgi:peptide/nickel transport system substrate-binding protein